MNSTQLCSSQPFRQKHLQRRHRGLRVRMLHPIRKEVPEQNLIAGPTYQSACADCRYIKKNTLENLTPTVELSEDFRTHIPSIQSFRGTLQGLPGPHARAIEVKHPHLRCLLSLNPRNLLQAVPRRHLGRKEAAFVPAGCQPGISDGKRQPGDPFRSPTCHLPPRRPWSLPQNPTPQIPPGPRNRTRNESHGSVCHNPR